MEFSADAKSLAEAAFKSRAARSIVFGHTRVRDGPARLVGDRQQLF